MHRRPPMQDGMRWCGVGMWIDDAINAAVNSVQSVQVLLDIVGSRDLGGVRD